MPERQSAEMFGLIHPKHCLADVSFANNSFALCVMPSGRFLLFFAEDRRLLPVKDNLRKQRDCQSNCEFNCLAYIFDV